MLPLEPTYNCAFFRSLYRYFTLLIFTKTYITHIPMQIRLYIHTRSICFNLVKKTFGEKSASRKKPGGQKLLALKSEGSFNHMPSHACQTCQEHLEAPRRRYCRKRTSSCHSQATASANHLRSCVTTLTSTDFHRLPPTSTDFQSSQSHLCGPIWPSLSGPSPAFFTFLGYSRFVKPKQLGPPFRRLAGVYPHDATP